MGFSFNSKKHNQDSRRSPQSFVKRQTCDLKVSKCGSLTTSDLPLNRLPWSWQATNQPSFLKDTGLGQNHGISEAPASTSFIHPGFVVTNLHDYMYIYIYNYVYIYMNLMTTIILIFIFTCLHRKPLPVIIFVGTINHPYVSIIWPPRTSCLKHQTLHQGRHHISSWIQS